MNPAAPNPRSRDEIEREAALWVLRRDRGLTAAEQDELSQWLAADPRHGEALAEHRWGWDELDRLTGLQTSLGALPDPDLLAPRSGNRAAAWRRLRWFVPVTLAAAAAVIVALRPAAPPPPAAATPRPMAAAVLAPPCERRALEDGSVVDLNRGAAIEVTYTPHQRRVRLLRGEANFIVARDPARPFIVSAGNVDVRAVGTIFNVALDAAAVEVVVSEGRVQVQAAATSATPPNAALVSAGETVVVPHAPAAPPRVSTLSPAQIAARLAWQPRLLDFTDATLAEMVGEFNGRNPVQLVIGDPALAQLRLSATFRSDNVEGFVRLMESDFGMKAEWRGAHEIVLRRAP